MELGAADALKVRESASVSMLGEEEECGNTF